MRTQTVEKIDRLSDHEIVSRTDWLVARKDLLKREKELTRLRDQLSVERRALPWVEVDKEYVFDAPEGKVSLADLFAGRSQLIIYHFMFDPDWKEGCPSCSFLVDHFDGSPSTWRHRDVTLSWCRARPWPRSKPSRNAWAGTSSGSPRSAPTSTSTSTSRFRPARKRRGKVDYNFAFRTFPATKVRARACSTRIDQRSNLPHLLDLWRGLDPLVGTYRILDVMPKGRDENDHIVQSADWADREHVR